jgi:hypothetical protein
MSASSRKQPTASRQPHVVEPDTVDVSKLAACVERLLATLTKCQEHFETFRGRLVTLTLLARSEVRFAALAAEAELARIGLGPALSATDPIPAWHSSSPNRFYAVEGLRSWLLEARKGDEKGWGQDLNVGLWRPHPSPATSKEVLEDTGKLIGMGGQLRALAALFAATSAGQPVDSGGTGYARPAGTGAPTMSPSRRNTVDGEGSGPTASLVPEEAAILKALLREHPVRLTVEKIEGKVTFTDKTIRKFLRSLRDRQLVEEPEKRKGHGLTQAGYKQAQVSV